MSEFTSETRRRYRIHPVLRFVDARDRIMFKNSTVVILEDRFRSGSKRVATRGCWSQVRNEIGGEVRLKAVYSGLGAKSMIQGLLVPLRVVALLDASGFRSMSP